ncbi:diaminopimelate decarboxylase [Escherichia coli]|uniref:Diaminopimelate decarboxylase n=1 Tax=Escherichia coli TaxID=562 RepID=A0A377D8X2_ECOLX|nr:diaminopimelate decarboxylase [Escherichia coli]
MMWRNHKKALIWSLLCHIHCSALDTDLTAENLLRLPAEFGCPVWVYDAQIIRRQIAALKQFDVGALRTESLFQYSYFCA